MTFNPQPKPEKQPKIKKVTAKVCKGTSKVKGFGCGLEVKFIYQYGLCSKCFFDWLTSDEQGIKYKQDIFDSKVKKKIDQSKKAEAKKKKESITDYSKKLQDKVNEIVRLIDIGLPCLAKGIHANQIHAGHIFSRGSNFTIRFNLHNIHRQSAQSNHFQNEDGLLREGLVNEYGNDYYEFVSGLRKTEAIKLSNQEFKDIYKTACKIALKLKKKGDVFTKSERINKRNEVNLELGIYSANMLEFKIK